MPNVLPSVVPPTAAEDHELESVMGNGVAVERATSITKSSVSIPKWLCVALFVLQILLPILVAVLMMPKSASKAQVASRFASALPKCLSEATHSCSAAGKGSYGGDVANIGSEGTSGKLWKAEKKRSYEGSKFSSQAEGRVPTALPRVRSPCAHWAVITTIFPPTVLVKQLVLMEDWCTVVVGDKKAPESIAYLRELPKVTNRFVYLTADDQDALGYSILGKLRWNHFGRKNVGFLYAIVHGAEVIYDTDDDNELRDTTGLPRWEAALRPAANNAFPEFRTCHMYMNPYPAFASRWQDSPHTPEFLWPRGFPLDGMRECGTMMEDTSQPVKDLNTSVIGVLQSLANHDPDVDAIYRLRHHLPIEFADFHGAAASQATAVVPKGTMAPFNAQATLWTKKAFWGLLLPITVHGRVSDIWRSYIVQRLMWEVGLRIAFAEPWVQQIRNAHTYLADFQSELPLYLTAGGFIRFLISWRPRTAITDTDSLLAAIDELTIALYEFGILELQDVELQQAWLRDLRAAGWRL